MQRQVSPIAAFIHRAPESAVGKETREPREHGRPVKEQERDKMGEEKGQTNERVQVKAENLGGEW